MSTNILEEFKKRVGEKVVNKKTTEVVAVGVKINYAPLNKVFSKIQNKWAEKQKNVLFEVAGTLVMTSPVKTGYLVENWRVNPTTAANLQADPFTSKGNRPELDEGQKFAKKEEVLNTLLERIASGVQSDVGDKGRSLKNSWVFYNRTPYFEVCEAKHGMIEAAKIIVEELT